MVSAHVWKYLFGMWPIDSDAIKIYDIVLAPNYEFKSSLNFMLKKPYSDRIVNTDLFPRSVTTGTLAPFDIILFWIVCHIIRPKKGGLSRVDKVEVQLLYVLKHKIKVHWPYYFSSRMFDLHN